MCVYIIVAVGVGGGTHYAMQKVNIILLNILDHHYAFTALVYITITVRDIIPEGDKGF